MLAKKQKIEEPTGLETENGKIDPDGEYPKEQEKDEPITQASSKMQETIGFLATDLTLNVLQSEDCNILTPLSEGGVHHFLAGARANAGIAKGRYLFEARVLQCINLPDSNAQTVGRASQQKHSLRIGVSTFQSCLLLGSSETDACFDSDGFFIHNNTKTNIGCKFGLDARLKYTSDDVVALLLNLDETSPNFNTISLFRNGKRACEPQQLPESLKNQTLYPHVSFKGVSLYMNFGPVPLSPLPFTCRMVQEASPLHVQLAKAKPPAGGKYNVLIPVSLPDQATFAWVDMFLENNPDYMELSERTIQDWAQRSGIWKPKDYESRLSNDRHDIPYQVRELDDGSVRRALFAIAPMVGRNYVIMEVKNNLLRDGRAWVLNHFPKSMFKTTAKVILGEPSAEWKSRLQQELIKQKQTASDKEFEVKRNEAKKKALFAKRQKDIERARRRAEREKERELEADRKTIEVAQRADQSDDRGEEARGGEQGEPKEGGAPPESDCEDVDVEEPAEEQEPPKVALTDEEQAAWFRTDSVKDLTAVALSSSFKKFSIPDEAEGFDDIQFDWTETREDAEMIMKSWVSERKVTTRLDGITPSESFNQRYQSWRAIVANWQSVTAEWKIATDKRAQAKAAEEARAKHRAAAEIQQESATCDGEAAKEAHLAPQNTGDDETVKDDGGSPLDLSNLDVFGVEDVLDVGNGVPIFAEFWTEDWTMLSLRIELYLLHCAFKTDSGDESCEGIFLEHLPFYFNRYFKKTLSTKDFGVDSFEELVKLVSDAVYVTPKSILASQVDEEIESPCVFAKLTEESRRHRALRQHLGDETARLKLAMPSLPSRPGGWQASRGRHQGWQLGPKGIGKFAQGQQQMQQHQPQQIFQAQSHHQAQPFQQQRALPYGKVVAPGKGVMKGGAALTSYGAEGGCFKGAGKRIPGFGKCIGGKQ